MWELFPKESDFHSRVVTCSKTSAELTSRCAFGRMRSPGLVKWQQLAGGLSFPAVLKHKPWQFYAAEQQQKQQRFSTRARIKIESLLKFYGLSTQPVREIWIPVGCIPFTSLAGADRAAMFPVSTEKYEAIAIEFYRLREKLHLLAGFYCCWLGITELWEDLMRLTRDCYWMFKVASFTRRRIILYGFDRKTELAVHWLNVSNSTSINSQAF